MLKIVLIGVLFLTGCASSGTKIDANQISAFKEGETTKEQVIAILGEPNSQFRLFNGDTSIGYSHVSINKPLAFVPIVGLFTNTDVKSQTYMFMFDKEGRLKSSGNSQTKGSAGVFHSE